MEGQKGSAIEKTVSVIDQRRDRIAIMFHHLGLCSKMKICKVTFSITSSTSNRTDWCIYLYRNIKITQVPPHGHIKTILYCINMTECEEGYTLYSCQLNAANHYRQLFTKVFHIHAIWTILVSQIHLRYSCMLLRGGRKPGNQREPMVAQAGHADFTQ